MTHRGGQFFLINWLKKARYIPSHPIGGAYHRAFTAHNQAEWIEASSGSIHNPDLPW
jgi:hypothetical protein